MAACTEVADGQEMVVGLEVVGSVEATMATAIAVVAAAVVA